MKKLIVLLITLFVMPSVALAAKGGTKPDYQALIDAEATARAAADTALQQQIDEMQPPPEPVCGMTGAWAGNMEINDGDSDPIILRWIGTHTSMNGIKGEMLLNWTHNNLLSNNVIDEMLPGTGVWELIDSDTGTYSFTWYSQVTWANATCEPTRLIKVSGTAQINNCDEVIINYLFEIEFEYSECELDWYSFPAGTAYEYRMHNLYTPPAAQ